MELMKKFQEYQHGQAIALQKEVVIEEARTRKRRLDLESRKVGEEIRTYEEEQADIVNNTILQRNTFLDKEGFGDVEAANTERKLSRHTKRRIAKNNSTAKALTYTSNSAE